MKHRTIVVFLFLIILLLVVVVTGVEMTLADEKPASFKVGTIMPAPDDPQAWPAWRDWLTRWRENKRKYLNYDDQFYEKEEFAWVQSSYVCCFAMMYDVTFCDPIKHKFSAEKFLEHGKREFGGYNSVVLWHAYPRIGFDERNQFDFYRDMPGGLEGLRDLSRFFHKKGLKVHINYNPWDTGTRREGKPDFDLVVEMVKAIEADGIFLDTMGQGKDEFRQRLDAVRPGVILESEGAMSLESVPTHHMSWAQRQPNKDFFKDSAVPGVMRNKWFERRHMQHQISRWSHDHTEELQMAWMNGSGMMVWENVFGAWVGWNALDRFVLRSISPIQHRYSDLFSGENWTPLVETKTDKVYASLWEGDSLKLWTLINRADEPYDGDILAVPHKKDTRYFDLVRGEQAQVEVTRDIALLKGKINSQGIGGFLAVPEKEVTRDFKKFLKQQAQNYKAYDGKIPSVHREEILKPVTRTKQYDKNAVPEGMVAIDGDTIEINVEFTDRECKTYQTPHKRKVELSAYAIDLTPVTNEQYKKFLESSGYKPRHGKNFLKHWVNGKIPEGKEDHPVVYVDLDDARAYAKWAGKRLPTEDEWQNAAQGPECLKYPWGNEMKSELCNDSGQGTTSVHEYPDGRSPYGCYDMCGNTWEWTESERNDGRTRFCVLRGGSFYKAQGSHWYAPGGPATCNYAAKFLLMWPGLDRCSTIGFRCVADLGAK